MVKFKSYEPISDSKAIFFMTKDVESSWDNLSRSEKDLLIQNLLYSCKVSTTELAIETLCHVISDMDRRLKALEGS